MNGNFSKQLIVGVLALAFLTCNFAYAKRLGGGSSMGRQSSTVTKNQSSLPPKPAAAPVESNPTSAARPATTPTPAAPAPVQQPSRFGGLGGILGGVAAGIGLSYLFSHMGMGGFGEGLASVFSGILMLALGGMLLMFLMRKFGNKSNFTMAPSVAGMSNSTASPSYGPNWNNPSTARQEPIITDVTPKIVAAPASNQSSITPSNWSDKDSFLQNAKSLFLQLQEASDQQNIEKLREYTTPELYNLLRQDMLSRSSAFSFTQVLTLAADLVAVEENDNEYLASTRFSGTIREEKDGPVTDFEEVWNWVKPIQGNVGWLLCGIQQIH